MEFHGHLNLLKTGLVFADSINTVSPRYALEIQSSPLGCGLEGVLQVRRDVLFGILNGIDPEEWNPATDPHLSVRYDVNSYGKGKPICKAALQHELGLPQEAAVPLIGMIGRLTEQKGFDLVLDVMQRWVQTNDAQWAILGTGQPKFQKALENLAQRFPQKVGVRMEYSNPLAHRIEAGSDLFLMPSRYEPCGLSQLYSLRYGTVPVVRVTGGLADTIVGYDDQTAASGAANGFSFQEYSALALGETLRQACDAYRQPEAWKRLVTTGMKQDWSWTRSAKLYAELYQSTLARKKST
jgi:starch synthase